MAVSVFSWEDVTADDLSSTSRKDVLFLGAAAANSDELETSLRQARDISRLLESLEKIQIILATGYHQPAQRYLQAIHEVSICLEEALQCCGDERGNGLLALLSEAEPAEAEDESRSLLIAMYRDSPGQLWEMLAHDIWAIELAAKARFFIPLKSVENTL